MRKMIQLATAAATLIALPNTASAAVTVTISQVGADVVATTSGTLSLTGLTFQGNFNLTQGIIPSTPYVATGTPSGARTMGYTGFVGAGAFGSGFYTAPSSSSGGPFAFNGSGNPYVFVSQGFTSGESVAGAATYNNTTLAAMGLATGTFVYRSSDDMLTVSIGSAPPAVPEPTTWAMMMLGFSAISVTLRRRRRNLTGRIHIA